MCYKYIRLHLLVESLRHNCLLTVMKSAISFFSKHMNPTTAQALVVLGDAWLPVMCLPCTTQLPHLILYFALLFSASSTSLNLATQLGLHRYCSWFDQLWKSCGWRQELFNGHLRVRVWFCVILVRACQVQFHSVPSRIPYLSLQDWRSVLEIIAFWILFQGK